MWENLTFNQPLTRVQVAYNITLTVKHNIVNIGFLIDLELRIIVLFLWREKPKLDPGFL